jgi:hypothetical protein
VPSTPPERPGQAPHVQQVGDIIKIIESARSDRLLLDCLAELKRRGKPHQSDRAVTFLCDLAAASEQSRKKSEIHAAPNSGSDFTTWLKNGWPASSVDALARSASGIACWACLGSAVTGLYVVRVSMKVATSGWVRQVVKVVASGCVAGVLVEPAEELGVLAVHRGELVPYVRLGLAAQPVEGGYLRLGDGDEFGGAEHLVRGVMLFKLP